MSALPGGEYTGRAYCLVVIAILSGYLIHSNLVAPLPGCRSARTQRRASRTNANLGEYRSGLPDQAVANLFLRLL